MAEASRSFRSIQSRSTTASLDMRVKAEPGICGAGAYPVISAICHDSPGEAAGQSPPAVKNAAVRFGGRQFTPLPLRTVSIVRNHPDVAWVGAKPHSGRL